MNKVVTKDTGASKGVWRGGGGLWGLSSLWISEICDSMIL